MEVGGAIADQRPTMNQSGGRRDQPTGGSGSFAWGVSQFQQTFSSGSTISPQWTHVQGAPVDSWLSFIPATISAATS